MNAQRGNVARSLKAVAAVGTAVVAVGLLPSAASAQAGHGSSEVKATKAAAAAKTYTYLSYKKNKKDPSNSRLSLVFVQQINPDKIRSFTVDSWRAGSGLGTAKNKIGRDACVSRVGWLPSGTYSIQKFYNNHVGTVNGISWLLNDKRCKNDGKSGTKRTELFIHSEMKPNGKPGSTESTRWDGNSDYKSLGCIKLKPSDIRELKGYRSNYPKPTKLYVS
jgi:hypothetical protein